MIVCMGEGILPIMPQALASMLDVTTKHKHPEEIAEELRQGLVYENGTDVDAGPDDQCKHHQHGFANRDYGCTRPTTALGTGLLASSATLSAWPSQRARDRRRPGPSLLLTRACTPSIRRTNRLLVYSSCSRLLKSAFRGPIERPGCVEPLHRLRHDAARGGFLWGRMGVMVQWCGSSGPRLTD